MREQSIPKRKAHAQCASDHLTVRGGRSERRLSRSNSVDPPVREHRRAGQTKTQHQSQNQYKGDLLDQHY